MCTVSARMEARPACPAAPQDSCLIGSAGIVAWLPAHSNGRRFPSAAPQDSCLVGSVEDVRAASHALVLGAGIGCGRGRGEVCTLVAARNSHLLRIRAVTAASLKVQDEADTELQGLIHSQTATREKRLRKLARKRNLEWAAASGNDRSEAGRGASG